jgi:hypothetical protein
LESTSKGHHRQIVDLALKNEKLKTKYNALATHDFGNKIWQHSPTLHSLGR